MDLMFVQMIEETIEAILDGRSDQHCDVDLVTVDYNGGSNIYVDSTPYNLDKKEDIKKLEEQLKNKVGFNKIY
jgi:hypothetical protein